MQTEVNLPFITADASGPKHLNIKLTRAKLEALVESLIDRTIEPCKSALKDAGISAGEIDEVIGLIQAGTDVNFENDNKDTALHRACANGHCDIAAILIKFEKIILCWDLGVQVQHVQVNKVHR